MKNQPFYLFMDKLSVHTSRKTKKECEKYNIIPIFNITASPDFNPIETVFSFVKADFRRTRLNALANKRDFDLDSEVEKSFNCVTPEMVDSCFRKSYFLLKSA